MILITRVLNLSANEQRNKYIKIYSVNVGVIGLDTRLHQLDMFRYHQVLNTTCKILGDRIYVTMCVCVCVLCTYVF